MLKFLEQYSAREKAIVVVALLVALGVGVHAFAIEPYLQRKAELVDALDQARADLDWMRSAVARLPAGGGAPQVDAEITGTLANFVDQAVRRQGLSGQLSQMSPVGNDEIRMRYSAVDFNRLIDFIARVNESGLEIKDIRITAVDNPGLVDSSIVLVRR